MTSAAMPNDIRVQLVHLRCSLVPKAASRLMLALGWLLAVTRINRTFADSFWTTIRLPGWRHVVIYYPTAVDDPCAVRFHWILRHELVHAKQLRPWWGPWWVGLLYFAVPLPALLSGRWFVERPAYLKDIAAGKHTPRSAAQALWGGYLWAWPRRWMLAWFEAHRGPPE